MLEKKENYHTAEMQVLLHHIYEFNKGLRNLVLHTMHMSEKFKTEDVLTRKGIPFFIQTVNKNKFNVFFGKKECVAIIASFDKLSLCDFTDEQDFLLGIMLGYDRMQQCERYAKRKNISAQHILKTA